MQLSWMKRYVKEFNAKKMWDFFKQYQRDSQTKEIIVNNSNKEPQQPIDNKTSNIEHSCKNR